MDRLEAMRIFATVVELGGFSAASRQLRIPLSTVSRKVADLETYLGAQLLIRSTRTVSATDAGRHYYQDVRRIIDEVEEVEREVAGEFRTPKGRLQITGPTMFTRHILLPIANQFMRLHDEVTIRLYLTNTVTDLLEEHLDLGIRIGELADSTLVARHVGAVREVVCASPAYLDEIGRPDAPDDLSRHDCIAYDRANRPTSWRFRGPTGDRLDISLAPRITMNSIEGIVRTAIDGRGVAMIYAYQAAEDIAAGRLEVLLPEWEIAPHPVHLVYPHGRRLPQKVRAFIDFAQPLLRQRLREVDRLVDHG